MTAVKALKSPLQKWHHTYPLTGLQNTDSLLCTFHALAG